MRNKNSFVKLGLMGLALWCLGLSFTSAANLKLNIDKGGVLDAIWLKSMTPIHFADNWNDFWGLFYFSNGSGDEADLDHPIKVEVANGEVFLCKKIVKWFYYNAERWERLWPLDEETRDAFGMNGSLSMVGWLYTLCSQEWYEDAIEECRVKASAEWATEADDYNKCVSRANSQFKFDEHWYYGNLYQEYKWQKFTLIAWVDYTIPNEDNKFISINQNRELSPTFIRFGNKYPVGFVYDYNWWIGFVWCRIDGIDHTNPSIIDTSVKQILRQVAPTWPNKLVETFAYDGTQGIRYSLETPTNVDCSEIMWVEDTLATVVVEWILWMSKVEKDFWVVWNLSDDKTQYFYTANINSSTILNYAKKKAEILCRGKWSSNPANFTNSDVICLLGDASSTVSEAAKNSWKTLIVKNGNVYVKSFTDEGDTKNHDIFIDSWYLLVEDNGPSFVFTTWGFISSTTPEEFASAVRTAMSGGNAYVWPDSSVWAFLRGNFIVNGYIRGAGFSDIQTKYFIYWKFASKDNKNTLETTFAWRCTNWEASDWNFCPGAVRWWENWYANASLVIIDQNYKSPFFTAS